MPMRWGQRHTRPLAALAPLLLVSIFAVGCSRSATPLASDATSTAVSAGTPTVDGTSAKSGPVAVTLAKSRFSPDEPLLATVQNDLPTSIWVTDGHSGCSTLTVERLSGGAWNAVGQCALERPTKSIEIPAHSALPQRIGNLQQMDMGMGWAPGAYRVTLTYASSRSGSSASAMATVASLNFTVG
jgi:hypothetical protein